MTKYILSLATLCCLHTGAAAVPVVLASSLTQPPYAGSASTSVGIIAQAFRNTLGPAQVLSVTLPLAYGMRGDALGTGLTVAIFADSAGVPGAPLVNFSPTTLLPNINSNPQNVQFLPTSPFVLAANTRYWLGSAVTNGSTYGWSFAALGYGIGPGYLDDVYFVGTLEPEGFDLSLRILVEEVPELSGQASGSALALVAIALTLLSSRSRRKGLPAA